jgi:6-phosphofructo-2-kinase / fructose-2,6-biphosphatase 4
MRFFFILGRGKTHISRRLGRYLEFFHALPVKVFHVADYRRKLYGDHHGADWFDPQNEEASHLRESCQNAATVDMIEFLNQNENGVAILDSTNASFKRRQKLINMVRHNSYNTKLNTNAIYIV